VDVGRLRASAPPAWLSVAALAVTLLAYAFVHWAMVVNKYAETGVRIQQDRQHQVVSSGPYRYVRHPFYVSLIVVQLAYPVAVGSWLAYLPGLVTVALFVWRTAREDETLKRELEGYESYTRKTRYRLVPGVW
jgi:protein-S-isoprenylcysteine O-methyltransferase Ste14